MSPAPPLTRRAFARRSAAAFAAAAFAQRTLGCGEEEPPGPGKLISLGGATYREDDRVPSLVARNSYLFEAWDPARRRHVLVVRDYVRASGTSHVKLWIDPTSWPDTVASAPGREELWRVLASYDGGQLGSRPLIDRLDRQVRALEEDGVETIVGLYQRYPLSWSPDTRARFADERRGHEENEALPDDVGPTSPWAWFVEFLLARWRGRIAGLELVNEPNQWLWPQSVAPSRVGGMFRTAEELAVRHGWDGTGQRLLGPGLSDIPIGPGDRAHSFHADFTDEVLGRHLAGWRPRVRATWTHHSYDDVRTRSATTITAARRALRRHGWPDDVVWCTEAADPVPPAEDSPARRRRQAAALRETHAAYSGFPLFGQHVILDDEGADPLYGLRRAYPVEGRGWALRAPLPSWGAWAELG